MRTKIKSCGWQESCVKKCATEPCQDNCGSCTHTCTHTQTHTHSFTYMAHKSKKCLSICRQAPQSAIRASYLMEIFCWLLFEFQKDATESFLKHPVMFYERIQFYLHSKPPTINMTDGFPWQKVFGFQRIQMKKSFCSPLKGLFGENPILLSSLLPCQNDWCLKVLPSWSSEKIVQSVPGVASKFLTTRRLCENPKCRFSTKTPTCGETHQNYPTQRSQRSVSVLNCYLLFHLIWKGTCSLGCVSIQTRQVKV